MGERYGGEEKKVGAIFKKVGTHNTVFDIEQQLSIVSTLNDSNKHFDTFYYLIFMSTFFESSVNNEYEQECVQSLPIHIKNATGIIVCEPQEDGYNRKFILKNYPDIAFEPLSQFNAIEVFEVDFVGHAVTDFQGLISPMDHVVCDDKSKANVFYSNFISKVQESNNSHFTNFEISPSKDNVSNSTTPVKYIIAEITNSTSQKGAQKKVFQIERCLRFLQLKSKSPKIEDCIALAMIIGPDNKLRGHVGLYISDNVNKFPLSFTLFEMGRFGFIENRNTLLNKVTYFGIDVIEVKDRVQDMDAMLTTVKNEVCDVKEQVSNVKNEVCDVKEQVSNVKDQVSNVKDQVSNVKDQVSKVSDQVNLLVKLVIFMMMFFLFLVLFFSVSRGNERHQTEF